MIQQPQPIADFTPFRCGDIFVPRVQAPHAALSDSDFRKDNVTKSKSELIRQQETFLESKWMQKAKRPGAEDDVKQRYQNWSTQVNNPALLTRAGKLWRLMTSPSIGGKEKAAVIAALIYLISPLDFIPDIIPVIGWLDDLGIAAYVLSYVLKKADELPDDVTDELSESEGNVITGDLSALPFENFARIGVAESASNQSRHLDDLRKVCNLLQADSITPSIDAIERLAQQQLFRVMFVGRYNSGKSTLLNRLLGGDYLLSGPTPTTRAMTFILPGKSLQLTSQQPDGRLTLHDDIADLKDRSNSTIVEAKQLSLLLPAEILRSGVCLIDTPGIEDPNEDTTRLMQAEVKHCEAVVLVLDATLQIGAAEEAFIQNMMREDRARKLFVVANKLDKLPSDRVSVVLDAIRSQLLPLDVQPRVFGLAAKPTNDSGDAGVADFRSALAAFLKSGRSQEQQRIVEHQIRSLAGQLVGSAKAQAKFADMAESDRELQLQRLRQHQSEVKKAVATKQQEVKLILDRLETRLQSEFEAFCHDLGSTVCREIDESTLDQLRKSDLIERLIHQETCSFLEPKLKAIESELGDAANELPG